MSNLPTPVLTQLLGIRLGEASIEQLLERYLELAKIGVPGLDEASITLLRAEEPYTASFTGELALGADELQYERGSGPCIDAGQSGNLIQVHDMREETRWPDYAIAVVAQGVRSSLSVPLPLQTDLIGALNCYARSAGALNDSVDAAVEIASHIAVALANAFAHQESATLAADMRAAMASRAVIEQAKGVIMAQNRCSPDDAFDILRRASMGRNMKLRDLATVIVHGLQG